MNNPALRAGAPPRVALLLRSLQGSGVQRSLLLLAGEFLESGLEVDLLTCSAATGELLPEVPAGANLLPLTGQPAWRYRLKALRAGLAAPSLLHPLQVMQHMDALPALCNYLRQSRPVALLSGGTYANVLAILAGGEARNDHTRIVISEHNHLSSKTRRAGKRWKLSVARHLYGRADALVAVSTGVAEDLSRLAGIRRDRIATIYNPVITPGLLALATRTGDAHPWLRDDGPPTLLAVGKLIRRKGFDTLLRAFALASAERPLRLVILGEGRKREELQTLCASLGIADRVALAGFHANPFASMARARLFLLSSRWEGLGNVLIEALACGCPVVSTDCLSGPREILDHGRYGTLVPVDDPVAMAGAIHTALEQPVDREQLRARGQSFSAEAAAAAYRALLLGIDEDSQTAQTACRAVAPPSAGAVTGATPGKQASR